MSWGRSNRSREPELNSRSILASIPFLGRQLRGSLSACGSDHRNTEISTSLHRRVVVSKRQCPHAIIEIPTWAPLSLNRLAGTLDEGLAWKVVGSRGKGGVDRRCRGGTEGMAIT